LKGRDDRRWRDYRRKVNLVRKAGKRPEKRDRFPTTPQRHPPQATNCAKYPEIHGKKEKLDYPVQHSFSRTTQMAAVGCKSISIHGRDELLEGLQA